MPAYTYQQKSYEYGTGPLASQYPAPTPTQTISVRPEWVKPGEVWTPGQTQEQYTAGGGILANNVKLPEQPQYNSDLSTIDGTLAKNKSLLETKQAEAEALARQKEQEIKTAETAKGAYTTVKDWLVGTGGKTIGEARTEAITGLGYDQTKFLAEQRADIAEMETLRGDYDKSIAIRDQQIADVTGRPGQTMDFLNNQIAQINRNANVILTQKSSAINNKAAIMEMKQGNFDQAMKFANQAVEDYTWELNANWEMYKQFNEDNAEAIKGLKQEYKDALKSAESYALAQYEEQKAEQKSKMDLILDAANKGVDLSAYFDKTMEEAQKAYSKQVSGVIAQEKAVGLSKAVESDFNEDLASISAMGDRETALTQLNNIKTALVRKYGQENYDKLLGEVDRLFPIIPTPTPYKVPPYEIGKYFVPSVKEMVGAPGLWVEKKVEQVGSFFQGLFGGILGK